LRRNQVGLVPSIYKNRGEYDKVVSIPENIDE
jgi:hypothetical protein